jgi:putative ABC transport system substrate-binding protein
MKRRKFITLLGGAAAWPLVARAQQGRIPVIGILRPNHQHVLETFAEPFRRYMKAIGWEEGRNVRFLFVWTGPAVRSAYEEREALPVTSYGKGPLSIARRRKR